ncbi:hypothetical protein LRS09_28540 [Mesorhizobium sp. J428]|nr:hypothetical protein [Mesorhizobium sp. J428]MCR5860239.1 hypothetical protein [Mesorhizobium sp. J428]MCR5860443.1 hypothetical protein [Mesorhizobium sp. J428]
MASRSIQVSRTWRWILPLVERGKSSQAMKRISRGRLAGQLIAAKPHQLVGIGAVDVPCHEGHRAFAPAQVPGLYDGGIDHLRMRHAARQST